MENEKDDRLESLDMDPFEGFDFGNIEIDPDQSAWERLTEEIVQGNVIPIIGPDLLYEGGNIHRKLVDSLARKFKLKSAPASFSELIYDYDFLKCTKDDKDSIYTIVNQVFAQKRFPPSGLLKRVLGIRQFPFVITTSFTPIVEQAMREVWGDELRVMKFNNNPRENQDIRDEADLHKPTVYYMFGRVGDMAHRYVLTDTDMLDFCSSWLSDTDRRPKNLVSILKDKYLLMLGNHYSDWLFRFIWYSIRKASNGSGLYAYDQVDDELSRFLERNHTFLQRPQGSVVDQILKRLAVKLWKSEATKFDHVEKNVDIFISYSRSDSALVEQLYSRLAGLGKRVWYDRKDISYGGNFMDEIRQGIRTARYFVPLFSRHIEAEKNDAHVYRNEWDEAIQLSISLGRTYIIPVVEEGFDFYKASIPEKMKQHNAILFRTPGDMDRVAEQIIHTMNQE